MPESSKSKRLDGHDPYSGCAVRWPTKGRPAAEASAMAKEMLARFAKLDIKALLK